VWQQWNDSLLFRYWCRWDRRQNSDSEWWYYFAFTADDMTIDYYSWNIMYESNNIQVTVTTVEISWELLTIVSVINNWCAIEKSRTADDMTIIYTDLSDVDIRFSYLWHSEAVDAWQNSLLCCYRVMMSACSVACSAVCMYVCMSVCI